MKSDFQNIWKTGCYDISWSMAGNSGSPTSYRVTSVSRGTVHQRMCNPDQGAFRASIWRAETIAATDRTEGQRRPLLLTPGLARNRHQRTRSNPKLQPKFVSTYHVIETVPRTRINVWAFLAVFNTEWVPADILHPLQCWASSSSSSHRTQEAN